MDLVFVLAAAVLVTAGLPLGALAWSRSKHVRRPAAPSWHDVLYAVGRRSGCTAQQFEEIEYAVTAGRLASDTLRRATAEVAAARARELQSRLILGRGASKSALFTLAAVIAVQGALALVVSRWYPGIPFTLVFVLLTQAFLQVVWWWQLRKAARAELLNGGMRIGVEALRPDGPH